MHIPKLEFMPIPAPVPASNTSSDIEEIPELSGIEDLIEELRLDWQIPGTAIAVVHEGNLIFQKGFGLRDVEKELPFTPETLLRVASTTKSFTSTLAGQLADEGLIDWTRPVREYLPDFQMFDAFTTAEMTLEDMMCHRTGLPYHENLLATGVGRELTGSPRAWREKLLKRMRHFKPSHPFRTHFQYQDIVFTAAGGILEHITDTDYERLMSERLLEPLGMVQSTYSRQAAKASGILAKSYAKAEGKVEPMDFIDVSFLAPTAGLYSTATEMIRWVQFHLENGRVHERQLVSRESMDWIHAPHMVVDDPPSSAHFQSTDVTYGLGWFRSHHRGRLLISHGGSFNGHRTNISFMPELRAGVVVLCNLNLTSFPGMMFRILFDRLLGIDGVKEWDSIFKAMEQAQDEQIQAEEAEFLEGRRPENEPVHALAEYAGTYTHPGYGTFVVAAAEEGLVQTFEDRPFPLEMYDGETFATRFQSTENNLLHLTMNFESDSEGRVVAVTVPLIPGIPEQRFVRE